MATLQTFNGGGVYNSNSSPSFTNVTISGNEAFAGGGAYNSSGSPSFSNVTVSGNTATYGGGVLNDISDPAFINAVLSGNTATEDGGGIYNVSTSPNFTNVTISGNTANNGGGAYNSNSNPAFFNSIIWGNSTTVVNSSSTPTYAYSLVQDCKPIGSWVSTCGIDDNGSNLADTDPLFVNPVVYTSAPTSTGDYRLQTTSPVVNVGNNGANTESTDRDGRERVIAATIDLGAYELPLLCGMVANAAYSFAHNGTVTIDTTGATMGTLSCLYIEMINGDHPNATDSIKTGRYWKIRGLEANKTTDASGFSGLSLTLPTLFTPDTNDKVCRYDGSAWGCAANSFDATNKTVIRIGIDGFSDWAVGDDAGPTAITLFAFTATREGEGVRIQWATGSELNTAGFRLERGLTSDSAAASPLEAAGFIASAGDVIGAKYSYLDRDAAAAVDAFYWLVEVERDGDETRYGPVRVAAPGLDSAYRVFIPCIGR